MKPVLLFPANFAIGDYIEFVGVQPISADVFGYYKIAINYARRNIAAAATHIAAISHYNPTCGAKRTGD